VPQSLLVAAGEVIEEGDFAASRDVCFWHKADMPIALSDVRFRE